MRPADGRDQRGFIQLCEITHGADPESAQPFQGRRPHPPERVHRQRVQELQLLAGSHLPYAAALDHARWCGLRFGRDRRQLGEELAGRHTHRTVQVELLQHLLAQVLRDVHAAPEKSDRASHIEERFIQRERLYERRDGLEDLVHLRADLRVQVVVARQEHHLRAHPACPGGWHRRVEAEPSRLVGRGSDDTTRAGAADHHRLAAQIRPPAQLHAHVERVHVDVQDRTVGRRARHARRSMWALRRSAPRNRKR